MVVVWIQHKLHEKMGVKMFSECNLNIGSFRSLSSTFKTYGSGARNFLLSHKSLDTPLIYTLKHF